ncbi:bifunctional enzyme and transcriptional regulator [Perkinsela sp. CCAP 1560/4]|nr:bifunctional enzyme and transcriptional regulator [Perkinsela sp. CCAP 1560/4]|eukprot:KNH09250.1 bifunctional enzyme and transcriptional regulator [Perkinsela sp. CCAP 1560/4]
MICLGLLADSDIGYIAQLVLFLTSLFLGSFFLRSFIGCKTPSTRNILLVGPPSSGKTCLFYRIIGKVPPVTYTSLKSIKSEFRLSFMKEELPSSIRLRGGSVIAHDVPGSNFSSSQIQKFLTKNDLLESMEGVDFVFVADGTMLLNNLYQDEISSCLLDLARLKQRSVRTKTPVRICVVLTRSDSPLFMHFGSAKDLIRKKLHSKKQLKEESNETGENISANLGNLKDDVEIEFISSGKNEDLRPALLKWLLDAS